MVIFRTVLCQEVRLCCFYRFRVYYWFLYGCYNLELVFVRCILCGFGINRVDFLFSVVRGKVLIGYLFRVCYILRVVDDTEIVLILWV